MIQLKPNPDPSLSKPEKIKPPSTNYARQHFDPNWSMKNEDSNGAYNRFVSGESGGEHLARHHDPYIVVCR